MSKTAQDRAIAKFARNCIPLCPRCGNGPMVEDQFDVVEQLAKAKGGIRKVRAQDLTDYLFCEFCL